MSSIAIGVITFGCVTIGTLVGFALRTLVPDHHKRDDSENVLTTTAGLIATLVALVIGLLVSSAKDSFDSTSKSLTEAASKAITLDRLLARYGPEANDARALRSTLETDIHRLWPDEVAHGADLAAVETSPETEDLHEKIRGLTPKNDVQRQQQAQALQLSYDLMPLHWALIERAQTDLPVVLLMVLIFWLTVLFVNFGILSPCNATTIVALLVCALSMSIAVYLILDMNRPFEGSIRVSSAPVQKALTIMRR